MEIQPKRRGGHTWWVLDLGTWRRAALVLGVNRRRKGRGEREKRTQRVNASVCAGSARLPATRSLEGGRGDTNSEGTTGKLTGALRCSPARLRLRLLHDERMGGSTREIQWRLAWAPAAPFGCVAEVFIIRERTILRRLKGVLGIKD